jgi:hypothetical protein
MGQSPSSTEIETDDFALELRSQQAWERYSHKPTDRVFAGTSVCKFVVQRGLTNGQSKSLGKAYFLNSTKWAYHYGFAQKVLGYDDSLSVFNQDMYTHFPRKYVLGTIVNYPDHVCIVLLHFSKICLSSFPKKFFNRAHLRVLPLMATPYA